MIMIQFLIILNHLMDLKVSQPTVRITEIWPQNHQIKKANGWMINGHTILDKVETRAFCEKE